MTEEQKNILMERRLGGIPYKLFKKNNMNITTEEIILERRCGGVPHKLIQYRDNKYIFCVAEDWMPLRVIGKEDNIKAIDADGGPMISVGSVTEGRTVSKIYYKKGVGYIVEFEQ